MGKLGDRIITYSKARQKTLKIVACEMDINYKTFTGKLKRDSISAKELLMLSCILKIDLENFKISLGYGGDTPKSDYIPAKAENSNTTIVTIITSDSNIKELPYVHYKVNLKVPSTVMLEHI